MVPFFTDDKQHIIYDDYIYPIEEYIFIYGEDALPCENKGEERFLYVYYDILLELLDALGKFAHARKLFFNAKEGSNPDVKKVMNTYYGSQSKLWQEVLERKSFCWNLANILNEKGKNLGFKVFSEQELKDLLNFLYEKRRRAYFRRVVKEYQARDEKHSIQQIYERCLSKQKS